MSSIIPDVQILDDTDTWQSAITNLTSCQIAGGMALGASKPDTGRCELVWNNADQTKNPDPAGGTSALLRARRRIRVKASTTSDGYALQVVHTGAWSGPGGTAAIAASGTSIPLYDVVDPGRVIFAQPIVPVLGTLSTITFRLGAATGSPVGDLTYSIYADNSGKPGTSLKTGTFTPTASADNTVSAVIAGSAGISDGVTPIWLALGRAGDASNHHNWQASATNTYSPYLVMVSLPFVGSWRTILVPTAQCSVTTTSVTCAEYWSQVVSAVSAPGDVWVLSWEARAQFDSFANADQVQIVTNAETGTAMSYAYTNRWATYTLSFTASLAGTSVEPRFSPAFYGTGKNSQAVEYRNVTLKKNGGSTILVNGNFASGAVSPWTNTDQVTVPAGSNVISVIRDYRLLFNGKISRIEPAPFQAGPKTCRVIATDLVDSLKRRKVTGLALQTNQRGDQLVTTALALLPTANVRATTPGKLLDTGKQVFSKAFNGYSKDTMLFDALTDCAVSEYGLWWVDPDGTLRWAARDYPPKRSTDAVTLTLSGASSGTTGQPFGMLVAQDAGAVINKTVLTWHPRNTVSTGVVLGQSTSAVAIPPIQTDGSPGTITVTLTFRDPATQRLCGGENVITPLVATTDYIITDAPTYPGGYVYTTSAVFAMEVVSVDASQVTLKLKNLATGTLYANKLQVRGDAVVTYDPQTVSYQDDTAIASDDESAWSKDMPFNDDGNFIQALGPYLVNRFKAPFDMVEQVSADWRATLGGVDVLSVEPMDVLSITDAQSGLTTPMKHIVTRWAYLFQPDGADYIANVAWGLERLDDIAYLILDDATYGKLDTGRLFI